MSITGIRTRYLDLLEKVLLDQIYRKDPHETRWRTLALRLRHPYLTRRGTPAWPPRALTMIGAGPLHHLRHLVERTILENIPGDYIETGVWRGGACILIKGVLVAHGIGDRRVYVADTFAGLPRPDARYPADKRDRLHAFRALAVSEDEVRQNFAACGLLDDDVIFLKGLFEDSLPPLSDNKFALIRLDGDMYGSTISALASLYDQVSPSGFIVVDDYGGLRNCAMAVHDFLDRRGLRVQIQSAGPSCVWWQKDA